MIEPPLPANAKIVSNIAGITGGVRLWDGRMDHAFAERASKMVNSESRASACATSIAALRGEQRRRAVAFVVLGAPLDLTRPQWPQRLGAVQRLDLALFIDTEHQSPLRRVEVEADNVTYFLNELIRRTFSPSSACSKALRRLASSPASSSRLPDRLVRHLVYGRIRR